MKANPFLTKEMAEYVDRIEVCSMGEFEICRRMEIPPEKLFISGVLKKKEDIYHILDTFGEKCRYTVESVKQLHYFLEWSDAHMKVLRLYPRLTNGSQFGMDEETVRSVISIANMSPYLEIEGIHYFSGTQKRRTRQFQQELEMLDRFLRKMREEWKVQIRHLEYGPGTAVPYFRGKEARTYTDEGLATLREAISSMQWKGKVTIEGVDGILASTLDEALSILGRGAVPVLVDPSLSAVLSLSPEVLVDAAIAKRNLGTRIDMAPLVVALGPGFTAGVDADAVIETKRGHTLGSVIYNGSAIPNTGVPGNIAGYAAERVMHSPCSGAFRCVRNIGDIVHKGEAIAYVGDTEIPASIDGKIRGLLHDGLFVPEGFKIADIDPRGGIVDHLTVSDKARAIAGGVLEAVDGYFASKSR